MRARYLRCASGLLLGLALAAPTAAQTISETRLTAGAADANPTWSADGRRIVFQSDRGPGLWFVPSTGGAAGPSSLGRLPAEADPDRDVSPDGSWVAYSEDGDLWVQPTAGGRAVRVTSGPPRDVEPAWAPDGFRLAFVRDGAVWMAQLAQVDIAVTKSVDNPTPNENEAIVFTVSAFNDGPDDATGIAVTDWLPTGTTFVSAAASPGSYDDATGLWTIGNLANGAVATLDITATVDPGTAGTAIQNLAGLSASDQIDIDPTNNSGAAVITVPTVDLAITKGVNDPGPNEGDTVTYTVTVSNAGADGATGVEVTDLLPAGLTYSTDSTSQGTYADSSGIWTVGDVSSGASAMLYLSATVDAGTGGTAIQNTATRTASDQADINGANDSDTADILVESADLAVAKTVDDPNPNQGDTILFTVTVTNLGPDSTDAVAVTDQLPAGITYSGHDAGQGTYASGTGVWTVGGLGVGAFATLDISATVDSGNPGATIQNAAAVTGSDHLDPNAANDADAADILVQSADIAVTKAVSDPTPSEGDIAVYTITATNTGPDPAASLQVTDLLPAGLTYQSAVLTQGQYVDSTGTWDVGGLAVSATATLTLRAVVDAGTAGMTIINDAARTFSDPDDPNPANDLASVPITVQAADLEITKSVDSPMPNENDTITYTLTVANLGPDPATGVEVTDLLPAGVTYQGQAGQGTYDDLTGLWTVGSLAVSTSATLDIMATVDSGTAGSTISNTATVTALDQTDPNEANDSDTADVTVGAIDLEASKTVSDSNPNEGDTVVYTVTVTNLGPDAASGIVVADSLPVGVTYQTHAASQGFYDENAGQWTVGSLGVSMFATLDITIAVAAGTAGTTILNTAAVTASDQVDTNPANDSDTVAFTIQAIDIGVMKIVDLATPAETDTVQYTVTVTNSGPDGATGVTVVDLVPAGLTFVGAIPSQGSYLTPTGLWTIGSLPNGGQASLMLLASVDTGTAGTTIWNVARYTDSRQTDTNDVNDVDSVAVTVQSIDIAITKTVDDPAPDEGGSVVFTITATNGGILDATGVEVTDVLPAGLTFDGYVASQGMYENGTGLWTVGALSVAGAATLDITAIVNAGTAGTVLTNAAAVSATDQIDPYPGNDADSVAVLVTAIDIAVDKTVDDPAPPEGGTVTYTLTATNLGPDPATNVRVTDQLPSGLTFLSDDGGGAYDDSSGVWSIAGLGVAASDTVRIVASVNVGTGSTTITNTATMTGADQTDVDPDNDDAGVDITVGQVVGVIRQAGFIPTTYDLFPGRPNPFRGTTRIQFDLPEAGTAQLAVYDVSGRRVTALVDGGMSAGRFVATWDGRDSTGRTVAAGVYFVRLQTGTFQAVKKAVRLD